MSDRKVSQQHIPRIGAVRPSAIRLSPASLVKTGHLHPEQPLPLVFEPQAEGVSLAPWARHHREQVERYLLEHGALLFRRFGVASAAEFELFARAVSSELIAYGERSSPRTQIQNGVYSSTDHPADQYIRLHNEQSYTLNWPMKIMFFCLQPAQSMGRTPIASTRRICERLSASLIEKFVSKQVMYVRNYGDGLGLPWQEVFQTTDRSVVEEHCREAAIEVEWKSNNRLRTRQVRPAIRKHPVTCEPVWFNHAFFFHISSLDPAVRASMLAAVSEEDLPFNTFYGDGSPFEEAVLHEISTAYQEETVSFNWEKGDILLLDNMLTSHGREPFAGPRQIMVSMADPFMSTYPEAATKSDGSST